MSCSKLYSFLAQSLCLGITWISNQLPDSGFGQLLRNPQIAKREVAQTQKRQSGDTLTDTKAKRDILIKSPMPPAANCSVAPDKIKNFVPIINAERATSGVAKRKSHTQRVWPPLSVYTRLIL